MIFDFDTFAGLAKQCYEPGLYSLDEVLFVFKTYFSGYERKIGRPHPHIRMEQIKRIIRKMPYLDEEDAISGSDIPGVFPQSYMYIIRRHFETPYPACDYNINHFFSGRIRELRAREAERG